MYDGTRRAAAGGYRRKVDVRTDAVTLERKRVLPVRLTLDEPNGTPALKRAYRIPAAIREHAHTVRGRSQWGLQCLGRCTATDTAFSVQNRDDDRTAAVSRASVTNEWTSEKRE